MCKKFIYLTSFVLVLALAGFAQAELLVNSDFEAGLGSWKTWGGGSGSGAGGWFYNYDTHAAVMEDGTAHSGDKYVEVSIADLEGSWWAVMLVFQEHPVTEGQTYQISAWFRDGDADGAPSLVEGGGMLQWEWRDAAPVGDPNTSERGNLIEGGRVTHSFDLTEEWTYVSATEVAPPGAKGATIIFGTTWGGITLDVDDTSYIEVTPSNYVTSIDQGGLIPIINRDFSEPNDGKHTAFDIEASRKQDEPFFGFMTTDVPGWTTDVSAKDSGIEIGDDPNYGYSAFLMGGYSEWDDDPSWVEPSIWQILPYKIQEGDQFRLAVDARHIWTVAGVQVELKMTLFYVDINGARQELASQIVDLTEAWEWGTYVLDVSELNEMAVGKLLGIELQNITIRSSWIHVDNVSLIGE